MLINRWIKKMCIYRIEYYSSIKKNEILQFSTSMDLKGIMISKNVRQRKTNTMCFNIIVKSKTRIIENRILVVRGERRTEKIKIGEGN